MWQIDHIIVRKTSSPFTIRPSALVFAPSSRFFSYYTAGLSSLSLTFLYLSV